MRRPTPGNERRGALVWSLPPRPATCSTRPGWPGAPGAARGRAVTPPGTGGPDASARPDRAGAGLPRGGRDRRQDRRPHGPTGIPARSRSWSWPTGIPRPQRRRERAGARALTGPNRLGKSQALNRGFAEARPLSSSSATPTTASRRARWPPSLSISPTRASAPLQGRSSRTTVGGREPLLEVRVLAQAARGPPRHARSALWASSSAIRAEAWRPIPSDVAIDDLWAALDIIEQGYRVAYEPRARALDPACRIARRPVGAPDPQRVRGALHVLVRRRRQLRPSAGLVAAELWGHRLARFTVSPLAHLALLGDRRIQGALQSAGPAVPAGQPAPLPGPGGRIEGRGNRPEDPSAGPGAGTCWPRRRPGRGR